MNNSKTEPAAGNIIVLGIDNLTPAMRRYWCSESLANRASRMGASVIDPFRKPLRELRKHEWLVGRKVYRASTGGKWGKSAQVAMI